MNADHTIIIIWQQNELEITLFFMAQSAGAAEYTDCIPAEG